MVGRLGWGVHRYIAHVEGVQNVKILRSWVDSLAGASVSREDSLLTSSLYSVFEMYVRGSVRRTVSNTSKRLVLSKIAMARGLVRKEYQFDNKIGNKVEHDLQVVIAVRSIY